MYPEEVVGVVQPPTPVPEHADQHRGPNQREQREGATRAGWWGSLLAPAWAGPDLPSCLVGGEPVRAPAEPGGGDGCKRDGHGIHYAGAPRVRLKQAVDTRPAQKKSHNRHYADRDEEQDGGPQAIGQLAEGHAPRGCAHDRPEDGVIMSRASPAHA